MNIIFIMVLLLPFNFAHYLPILTGNLTKLIITNRVKFPILLLEFIYQFCYFKTNLTDGTERHYAPSLDMSISHKNAEKMENFNEAVSKLPMFPWQVNT